MKKSLAAIVAALGVPLAIGIVAGPTALADPGPWYGGGCPNGYQLPRAPHVCAARAVIDDFGFVTPFALWASAPDKQYLNELPAADPSNTPFCGMYDVNAPGARGPDGRPLGCVRAVLPA